MVGRSTGVERLVCFRWFHSLVEVEGPVVDTWAGCPRWLGLQEILHTIYAVHALKEFSFSLLNGEIWIPVGLVVPWWSSLRTVFVDTGAGCLQWSRVPGAFVDTGAGCPAVVSGSGDARAWTDTPLPSRSTEYERG